LSEQISKTNYAKVHYDKVLKLKCFEQRTNSQIDVQLGVTAYKWTQTFNDNPKAIQLEVLSSGSIIQFA